MASVQGQGTELQQGIGIQGNHRNNRNSTTEYEDASEGMGIQCQTYGHIA